MTRLDVDEVNIEIVDLGQELRQGVQVRPCFREHTGLRSHPEHGHREIPARTRKQRWRSARPKDPRFAPQVRILGGGRGREERMGSGVRGIERGRKALLRTREQDAKPIARSRAERLLETLHRLEENRQVEIQANLAHEAWQAARRAGGVSGQRLGMPPKPFEPPAEPESVMNKTDHDSRMMRTQGQPTVQGYNAQAAVTRGQIIVAAEIAVESPDFGHLEPIVRAALHELEKAGVTQPPETVLADAGYWHTRQMENIVSDGIQVLVPPDAGLREAPGRDGTKVPTRSCAGCSPARLDTSCTSTAKRRSSRCSRRTSSTAASAASSDEAEPRRARSGGSKQPPTTY